MKKSFLLLSVLFLLGVSWSDHLVAPARKNIKKKKVVKKRTPVKKKSGKKNTKSRRKPTRGGSSSGGSSSGGSSNGGGSSNNSGGGGIAPIVVPVIDPNTLPKTALEKKDLDEAFGKISSYSTSTDLEKDKILNIIKGKKGDILESQKSFAALKSQVQNVDLMNYVMDFLKIMNPAEMGSTTMESILNLCNTLKKSGLTAQQIPAVFKPLKFFHNLFISINKDKEGEGEFLKFLSSNPTLTTNPQYFQNLEHIVTKAESFKISRQDINQKSFLGKPDSVKAADVQRFLKNIANIHINKDKVDFAKYVDDFILSLGKKKLGPSEEAIIHELAEVSPQEDNIKSRIEKINEPLPPEVTEIKKDLNSIKNIDKLTNDQLKILSKVFNTGDKNQNIETLHKFSVEEQRFIVEVLSDKKIESIVAQENALGAKSNMSTLISIVGQLQKTGYKKSDLMKTDRKTNSSVLSEIFKACMSILKEDFKYDTSGKTPYVTYENLTSLKNKPLSFWKGVNRVFASQHFNKNEGRGNRIAFFVSRLTELEFRKNNNTINVNDKEFLTLLNSYLESSVKDFGEERAMWAFTDGRNIYDDDQHANKKNDSWIGHTTYYLNEFFKAHPNENKKLKPIGMANPNAKK